MNKYLVNTQMLLLIATATVAVSVYMDVGERSWTWFQRSGSVVTLIGALLSYRSIVRLGVEGVGGTQTTILRGTIASSNGDGTLNLTYDQATVEWLDQARRDKIAGFLGACLVIFGTAIWGYGDLIGFLMSG